MPIISKKTKPKKVVAKKKTVTTKVKKAPVKKKIVKKVVAKKKTKVSAPAPKQANKIVVDIISDDEKEFIPYKELTVETSELKDMSPVFSSWPDFNNKLKVQAEDILSEIEEEGGDDIQETEPKDIEEYDKQKKFFSDWAMQNAPKEGEEKPSLAPSRKSVGLYRRQAVFYLGATLILLLAVSYFFFVKLTIKIAPQGETINDSVSFNIIGTDASSTVSNIDSAKINNKTINGDLTLEDVSAEKTYQVEPEDSATGETTGTVIGTVTLINKYNRNQPLVATTRLLSADGKLFRLKEAVNIPTGGTVTADVYADKAGADMVVAANTRFAIPGLWAGIQDRIYAENSAAFTYQTQTKRVVKQSDLDKAKKDINEVLDLKIKNELQAITSDKAVVYGDTQDDIVTDFNVKVGDLKNEFTVNAHKKIVAATFSKDKAVDLAKARLSLIVSDDKRLSNFNQDQIKYSLENFDTTTKTAEIKAYFTGLMSLKSDSSLIDRNKLVGLNEAQISQYLNTFPEVKDYKLEFWPSFIKTAPNLPDRITIQIGE
jgi:hypothetical protein